MDRLTVDVDDRSISGRILSVIESLLKDFCLDVVEDQLAHGGEHVRKTPVLSDETEVEEGKELGDERVEVFEDVKTSTQKVTRHRELVGLDAVLAIFEPEITRMALLLLADRVDDGDQLIVVLERPFSTVDTMVVEDVLLREDLLPFIIHDAGMFDAELRHHSELEAPMSFTRSSTCLRQKRPDKRVAFDDESLASKES